MTTAISTIPAVAAVEKLMPSAPLQTIEGLNDRLRGLEKVANIVTPLALADAIPAMHAISLRAVRIEVQHDTYFSGRFCQRGERALGGRALQKIINAAGATILLRRRMDDRSEPFYCEMEVTLAVRDYDGVMRSITKAKELDFRDGAPDTLVQEKDSRGQRTGKMVPMDAPGLGDKRRHIQSLAETEALYRCARTIFNLRQKYNEEELAKPFIVPKLVVHYDMNDPDQKRAAIEQASRSELAAFGQHFRQLPPPPQEAEALPPPPIKRRRTVLQRVAAIFGKGEVLDVPEGPSTPSATSAPEEPDPEAFVDVLANVPAEAPQIYVCTCPCGCQTEIALAARNTTIELVGAPRCRQCFPGSYFNYERHKDLPDLCLPKKPGATAEKWIQALEARRAQAQKGDQQ